MIRNYIVTALRNLWRNKMVTLINIIGMTLGFGIFISLSDWVRYDLSYDRFHDDIEQIYNLKVRMEMNGSEYSSDRTAGIFTSLLKDNYAQVESSCRMSQAQQFELGVAGDTSLQEPVMKYFNENEVIAVDSVFLKFFTFALKEGNPDLIFSEKNHIVLTESMAKKLFGEEPAINQDVKFGEGAYFTVAGIVEDPPETSSIQFSVLIGFHIMEEMGYPVDGYGGTMYYSFFKIPNLVNIEELNKSINELVDANYESDLEAYYFLEQFSRLHLYGESRSIIGVYVNAIMSFLILIIACINFINLTMAYSMTRLKEISIRKAIGASKRQLIGQFLSETYILLLVAFYLGLVFAEQLVPVINRSFGVTFDSGFKGFTYWSVIIVLFFVTGLIAGLYPSLKIANFNPLASLSGEKTKNTNNGKRSRKVLIVTQFTFSIILSIISIFIIRQYTYLKEADLGFNREDVVYIHTNGKVWDHYDLIKEEIENLHFVDHVATGSEVPVMLQHGEIDWGERDGEHNKISRILWTDPDFLSTFDIDITQGNYFNERDGEVNHDKAVVNESLVELMHWEDPVGKNLYFWGRDLEIIGVTENINFFPFNIEIFGGQALIYLYDEVRDFIFVRIRPGIAQKEIDALQAIFEKHNPGYEFIHNYVSEYEYKMLEGSDGIKILFKIFSVMAIFIALMGLIGLSLFNSNRRTKEIGIRKVMGAHSSVIINLLLSEFIKLIVISNVIAIPTAYFALGKLLNIFSYRVDLKASVFIIVSLLSIGITVLTVAYHAFRIARSNPVNSLRYE